MALDGYVSGSGWVCKCLWMDIVVSLDEYVSVTGFYIIIWMDMYVALNEYVSVSGWVFKVSGLDVSGS